MVNSMAGYIVHNDNTFGYPISDSSKQFFRLIVMAVDVEKGGDPTLIDREVLCNRENAREATAQDAERFKVRIAL